ncbi:unnamed protein product [Adineta steineri]|uniref:NHL repeat containing protein n=1 Tax=Adineta steineri TaxID=433720 RepID=A0A815FQS8_9BILA|nr:unnamed protein product [Adineta steineri]CAF1329177.1 unnamed protein product [Adineta steineri]CAF1533146.1 unnamed protein product [Adineta steineri]CAF1588709.1 unnamed protein product [Adineta steineri]
MNTKWKQSGITIAGGDRPGKELNQLFWPQNIYVDDDQMIYIADYGNDRILKLNSNENNSQVVASRSEYGNRIIQLFQPTDITVDKKNDSLIICDWGNRRVVRWSSQNDNNVQILISDVDCYGITMDKNGNLYVSDYKKDEVRQWKKGEVNGTIIAGGNGKGNNLNQLNWPTFIFVDQDCSLYVSDNNNHRVMKWIKDAKQGIIVAGGHDQGNNLTQLSNPHGIFVDHLNNVYVADFGNHRIVRWSPGSKEGSIIVGGNGEGKQQNQLNGPIELSLDFEGHFYVVDHRNNRIQKFLVDLN